MGLTYNFNRFEHRKKKLISLHSPSSGKSAMAGPDGQGAFSVTVTGEVVIVVFGVWAIDPNEQNKTVQAVRRAGSWRMRTALFIVVGDRKFATRKRRPVALSGNPCELSKGQP